MRSLSMQNAKIAFRILMLARSVMAENIPGLGDILRQLDDLHDLSDSIQEKLDTFEQNYRSASVMNPEIITQQNALSLARKGRDVAIKVQNSIKEMIASFPEDKTVKRAMADAETLVSRYTKQSADLRKMIAVMAKKELPPALKTYAAKLAAAVKVRLVNPDDMEVIPWVVHRDGNAVFEVNFNIPPKPKSSPEFPTKTAMAYFDTGRTDGPLAVIGDAAFNGSLMKSADFADKFLDKLKGWPGIKGADIANKARAGVAQNVADALTSACRRMGGSSNAAVIEQNGTYVSAEYRSNLPKEGAQEVGENDYEEMVDREIERFKKVVVPMLQSYKDSIKKMGFQDEEKSWITVWVELK